MKVEIRNTYSLWKEKQFSVEKANLRYERFDGEMSQWVERVNFERGDSAAALIYNRDTRKFGLVKQFRYSSYRRNQSDAWILELVAGTIESDETSIENISKELLEETGFSTHHRLSHLFTFYASPGGTSERIHLFYLEVNNLDRTSKGGGVIGSSENIQYIEYSVEELKSLLSSGGLKDAKTIIAVQWLLQKLKIQDN
jgi:ADP-ribose pyrophosphatase